MQDYRLVHFSPLILWILLVALIVWWTKMSFHPHRTKASVLFWLSCLISELLLEGDSWLWWSRHWIFSLHQGCAFCAHTHTRRLCALNNIFLRQKDSVVVSCKWWVPMEGGLSLLSSSPRVRSSQMPSLHSPGRDGADDHFHCWANV